MQKLNLEANDCLTELFAKLEDIDFNKDYKLEFENNPLILEKIANNRWCATILSGKKQILSKFEFSSAYNSKKEILIDFYSACSPKW